MIGLSLNNVLNDVTYMHLADTSPYTPKQCFLCQLYFTKTKIGILNNVKYADKVI